ncbi:MAG: hypothetical protein K9I68_05535 [Bacteroidales bacterium]|nr:hypothetical protein [Bacteroidales bacterium]MCF8337544.1 hypothetical protein [Bacteroidales bacterium]
MKKALIFFITAVLMMTASAQKPEKDTTARVFSLSAAYGRDLPGGDLKSRYGSNNSLGASFSYKSMSNWILMVEGDYLFSRNVKISDDIFENIAVEEGFIIDEGGIFTDMAVLEAGMTANFSVGKIFPVWGANPNSGLVFRIGGGYIFHKIRIEQNQNSAPQISGDYQKGYDRLTEGFNTSQFLGYHHLGNKNILNFYAGIEFHQAWTSSSRAYNFDQMKRPPDSRFDTLYGLKIGWLIPLGKQSARKTHYY